MQLIKPLAELDWFDLLNESDITNAVDVFCGTKKLNNHLYDTR